jgi:hypothetical protein
VRLILFREPANCCEVRNNDDEDMIPRNMVCFRYIVVHTLHKGGGGGGGDETSELLPAVLHTFRVPTDLKWL